MKCKNCNTELKSGDAFCQSCGTKVETSSESISTEANQVASNPTNVNTQKKGTKTPIIIVIVVAAVLLLVGLGLLLLKVFPNIINRAKTIDLTIENFSGEEKSDFLITWDSLIEETNEPSKYHKQVVWKDTEVYTETRFNINVLDEQKTKLFELNAVPAKNGTFLLDIDVTIKLNNGETVLLDGRKPIDSFDFYYLDDILIFDNNGYPDSEEYYLYNYKNNELFKVFSNKDAENEGFTLTSIYYINSEDLKYDKETESVGLTFYTEYDALSTSAFGTAKQDIVYKIKNNYYTSMEQLEQDLSDSKLDDFDYIKVYNYVRKDKKFSFEKSSMSIKEYYEIFGTLLSNDTSTACTGVWEKSGYNYILSFKNTNTCKTVEFKLNDDFIVSYHLGKGGNLKDYDLYVNDKQIDSGVLFGDEENLYVVGKTLVTREFSTDAGAKVLLVNASGEIYSAAQPALASDEVYYNLDGMITKAVKVDDNGDLIISGTRHSNQRGEGINGTYVDQVDMCNTPFSTLMSNNGVSEDYAFEADYTFKLKDNGLYNLEYSKATTTRLWKDFYNSLCN